MTKIISAYEARTNFGELLNQVYYQGEEILVTKTGKPMVKIIKADDTSLTGLDSEKIWEAMRIIAKSGKQVDGVEFLRKDRKSGHKIHP